MVLPELVQACEREQFWGNPSLYEYLFRFIASTKHISTLKKTMPVKADEQTATVYKGTYRCCGPLSTLWKRGNMSKQFCVFLLQLWLWHPFVSASGKFLFLPRLTIFMQASIAYLQNSNPAAAGLGLAFLVLLGQVFCLCIDEDVSRGLIWAEAQKFSATSLFSVCFFFPARRESSSARQENKF